MWQNVTSTTAVSCSVATLSSESLSNDGEELNQPKRLLFPKCDYGKIFVKNGCSGRFCNLSIYNQAVEVIYSLPKSYCIIQIAQAIEKVCNGKYLLKVAQTMIFS